MLYSRAEYLLYAFLKKLPQSNHGEGVESLVFIELLDPGFATLN